MGLLSANGNEAFCSVGYMDVNNIEAAELSEGDATRRRSNTVLPKMFDILRLSFCDEDQCISRVAQVREN